MERWKFRFNQFQKAFRSLEMVLDFEQGKLIPDETLYELERHARIKAFEYTFELAWKTLKDYLENDGFEELTGSKSTIRQAAKIQLIASPETWMDMVSDRNLTSHTYDLQLSHRVVERITLRYRPAFNQLIQTLKSHE